MNKSAYGFLAIAIVFLLLIAFRVDQKLAGEPMTVGQIERKADQFVSEMKSARNDFDKFTVERNVDQWRLRQPVEDDGESVAQDHTVTILIKGIMKNESQNLIMATLDGGAVLKSGDIYKGFEVLRVTDKGVSFNINGKMEFISVGEPFEAVLPMSSGSLLTLDAVENRDGKYMAVIDREYYKAGDWINAETQVKAVTPTMIMVNVDGENKFLKIHESLVDEAPESAPVSEE